MMNEDQTFLANQLGSVLTDNMIYPPNLVLCIIQTGTTTPCLQHANVGFVKIIITITNGINLGLEQVC